MLGAPEEWGHNYYKGIEPNEEWKHNVMMARMLMSENLCISSQATLELMKLWLEYETLLFVKLPPPREEAVYLVQFVEAQEHQMNKVKCLLASDWNKHAVEILREELENITDRDQTKTFFESVATLMSNQVRALISKSITAYVEFYRRFYNKDGYKKPDEIFKREIDADTPMEDNFLKLKLHVETQTQDIAFAEPLHAVRANLVKVVESIVQQSQNLPRPENTIARSEKMHLWEVSTDDCIVKEAVHEIEEILDGNLSTAELTLGVYDKYRYLLREKTSVEAFLAEPNHTRDEYSARITKYQNTMREIEEQIPREIRLNLFLIDCS